MVLFAVVAALLRDLLTASSSLCEGVRGRRVPPGACAFIGPRAIPRAIAPAPNILFHKKPNMVTPWRPDTCTDVSSVHFLPASVNLRIHRGCSRGMAVAEERSHRPAIAARSCRTPCRLHRRNASVLHWRAHPRCRRLHHESERRRITRAERQRQAEPSRERVPVTRMLGDSALSQVVGGSCKTCVAFQSTSPRLVLVLSRIQNISVLMQGERLRALVACHSLRGHPSRTTADDRQLSLRFPPTHEGEIAPTQAQSLAPRGNSKRNVRGCRGVVATDLLMLRLPISRSPQR